MSDIELEFDSEGFRQILMSEGVKSVVQNATDQIAARANGNLTDGGSEGYEGDVLASPRMSGYGSGGRWVGFVRALDYKAMADEAENKSLSRAVNG